MKLKLLGDQPGRSLEVMGLGATPISSSMSVGQAATALRDFASRIGVVSPNFPTSTVSDVFTSSDLNGYHIAWSVATDWMTANNLASAIPAADPFAAPLPTALDAVNAVVTALVDAGVQPSTGSGWASTAWVPWAMGLTAIGLVGIVVVVGARAGRRRR